MQLSGAKTSIARDMRPRHDATARHSVARTSPARIALRPPPLRSDARKPAPWFRFTQIRVFSSHREPPPPAVEGGRSVIPSLRQIAVTFRDVAELLLQRGYVVTHETVRGGIATARSCHRDRHAGDGEAQRYEKRAPLDASARGGWLSLHALGRLHRRVGYHRRRHDRRRPRPGEDESVARASRHGDPTGVPGAAERAQLIHRWRDRQRMPDV